MTFTNKQLLTIAWVVILLIGITSFVVASEISNGLMGVLGVVLVSSIVWGLIFWMFSLEDL